MAAMSRSPPQRRGAERETTLHLTSLQKRCSDGQSAGDGATRTTVLVAASLRKGWKTVRAETVALAPFTTARSPSGDAPNRQSNHTQQTARGNIARARKSVIPQDGADQRSKLTETHLSGEQGVTFSKGTHINARD